MRPEKHCDASVSEAGEHNLGRSSESFPSLHKLAFISYILFSTLFTSGLKYAFLVTGIDSPSLFVGSESVLVGPSDFWMGPISSQAGWVEVRSELLAWCSGLILSQTSVCCASR